MKLKGKVILLFGVFQLLIISCSSKTKSVSETFDIWLYNKKNADSDHVEVYSIDKIYSFGDMPPGGWGTRSFINSDINTAKLSVKYTTGGQVVTDAIPFSKLYKGKVIVVVIGNERASVTVENKEMALGNHTRRLEFSKKHSSSQPITPN